MGILQHNLPSRSRDSVVNVFIGPSFGILLSAKADGEDVKDELENTEMSFHIGGGITIDRKFTFDVHYTQGLTSINDEADIKNSGFLTTLGYLFK